MNPGKLNRRVTFGTYGQTQTAGQDYVITFDPISELENGSCWADLIPITGSRQLQAGEEVITGTDMLFIRYRTNWKPTKAIFVNYLDQYYAIHYVEDYKQEHRFFKLILKNQDADS